ncbi:MAG: hypothetical protein OEX13_13090, partial [Gammaproteobacteria bacterium]|nr:hypothetical protein [Gammaproteobacteria bacterium]
MNPYGEPSTKKDPIPDGRIFSEARGQESPVVTYTISARGKSANAPVFAFLRNQYGNIPLREIESLFGFVQKSTLYGGRIFADRELSDRDVMQLNNAGIGIRIPMSNHYVHRSEYLNNRKLLEQYERDINSIIVTNDDLAHWIRRDYP